MQENLKSDLLQKKIFVEVLFGMQLNDNAVLLHQFKSVHRVILQYIIMVQDLIVNVIHLVRYFTNTDQYVFHQEVYLRAILADMLVWLAFQQSYFY
jgi:hypothetical protein